MKAANKTKNIILAATITTAIAFAGVQVATAAGPGSKKGTGFQHPCPGQAGAQLDEATIKARDTFLAETTELRKSMAEKRAAKRALMRTDNPSPAEAAKLAGELFDLREQLRTKAQAAGLPAHMMMRHMMTGQMGMGDRSKRGCNGNRMGGKHHGGNMM